MVKYFCVDESGSFNTSYENYYIISGVIVEDIQILRSLHEEIEKTIRKNGKSVKELKAARIKDSQKAIFINAMLENEKINIVSLAIDKKKLKSKYDIKISEFLIYNYALKELCKTAMKHSVIAEGDDVLFLVDARTMNPKVYYDLEGYLKLEFFYKLNKINVFYKDSRANREIQMADYVSNTMYGFFNQTNHASKDIKQFNKIVVNKVPR